MVQILIGLSSLPGGGQSHFFWTLDLVPSFPDKSQDLHIVWIFFWTCQMPEIAADVDPIAHSSHFRSKPTTCTWQQIN